MNSHCNAMICLNNYWKLSISTKRAHQWSNLTKILAISNIIRIFAIAFKRKKAVSKKSITILSLLIEFRQDSSGWTEQLCFRLMCML